MRKLTPKQANFVREYLISLNALQACILAGYSKRTAHAQSTALMKLPHVGGAIQTEMDKRAARASVNADYVLEKIKTCVEITEKEGDRRNHLKGLELLGKHLKLFTDVQEVTHSFSQMGRVTLSNGQSDISITFDVGGSPDIPKIEKK